VPAAGRLILLRMGRKRKSRSVGANEGEGSMRTVICSICAFLLLVSFTASGGDEKKGSKAEQPPMGGPPPKRVHPKTLGSVHIEHRQDGAVTIFATKGLKVDVQDHLEAAIRLTADGTEVTVLAPTILARRTKRYTVELSTDIKMSASHLVPK
jgi:hypothetical protein